MNLEPYLPYIVAIAGAVCVWIGGSLDLAASAQVMPAGYSHIATIAGFLGVLCGVRLR